MVPIFIASTEYNSASFAKYIIESQRSNDISRQQNIEWFAGCFFFSFFQMLLYTAREKLNSYQAYIEFIKITGELNDLSKKR